MTTSKDRQERLSKIMQLVKLDDSGYIVDKLETEAIVRNKFDVSLEGSRMLVAQAARRLRYERLEVKPVVENISIPEAVRLASDLAEQGAIERAPGRAAIARAVLLGRIASAQQDSGRRWHFKRSDFIAWLKDAKAHRRGRK